jgi:hypothetical protein
VGATGRSLPLKSGEPAQQFLRLCDTNWPAGSKYGNPGVHDIIKLYLPSLEACIAACAEYNANRERNLGEGMGAVVGGEMGLCRAVSVVKSGKSFSHPRFGCWVSSVAVVDWSVGWVIGLTVLQLVSTAT